MIRKLQIKFIVIAIVSVTIVLSIFIAIININNYRYIVEKSDETLRLIEKNNGRFPPYAPKPVQINPEAPYETRYFSVRISADKSMIIINIDSIAAIDETNAVDYALKINSKGKEKGFFGHYRYLISTQSDKSVLYIFLDCQRELSIFRDFLAASLMISFCGLLVFFIFIIVFSWITVKPVAESYKKQKRFITDASHELKTPLTIIGANADILELEYGANEQTQSIKNQVERLTEFTNRLVYLSRLDEEAANVLMTDFSLSDVTEDTIKEYIPLIEAQNKRLECDITPNLTLYGDIKSIQNMINLLLDNAVKYSNDGGLIQVSLKPAGKNKRITISNTTDGIQKGNLDMLFERFYRLDSSRNSKTGGHGIGLSVVKAIVELHKGKITAYSNDGITITFSILL